MSTPGVPGGALPFSGPLDLAAINSEWGLGTDLTLYHGVRWYYDGNLTTDVFSSTTLKISDFYGKRATDPAASGVYFANTAGSSSFTVPLYRNSIKIEVWGGGGSGGGGNGGSGGNGGDSSILGITVGGGKGGGAGQADLPGPPLDYGTNDRGGRDPVTTTGIGILNGQFGIGTFKDGTLSAFFDQANNTYRDVQTGEAIGLGGPEGNG